MATIEVNDFVEILGVGNYVIGNIEPNKEGTRQVVRLDQKFKPSLTLIIRKRR